MLRRPTRVNQAELVATALGPAGEGWRLTARWVGMQRGARVLSAPLQIDFAVDGQRVTAIGTQLADHALVLGEALLRRAAFVSALFHMPSVPATLA